MKRLILFLWLLLPFVANAQQPIYSENILNPEQGGPLEYKEFATNLASTTYYYIGSVQGDQSGNLASFGFTLMVNSGWARPYYHSFLWKNRSGLQVTQELVGGVLSDKQAELVAYQSTTLANTNPDYIRLYVKVNSGFHVSKIRLNELRGITNAIALFTASTSTPSGTKIYDSTGTIPEVLVHPGQMQYPVATNSQSGSTYTLTLADCSKVIEFSAACTVTVPANLMYAGCSIMILQTGTGQVTFSAGASLTLNSNSSYLKTSGQWAMATLLYRTTTTAVLGGGISN